MECNSEISEFLARCRSNIQNVVVMQNVVVVLRRNRRYNYFGDATTKDGSRKIIWLLIEFKEVDGF